MPSTDLTAPVSWVTGIESILSLSLLSLCLFSLFLFSLTHSLSLSFLSFTHKHKHTHTHTHTLSIFSLSVLLHANVIILSLMIASLWSQQREVRNVVVKMEVLADDHLDNSGMHFLSLSLLCLSLSLYFVSLSLLCLSLSLSLSLCNNS
jgi:hypothetical protein